MPADQQDQDHPFHQPDMLEVVDFAQQILGDDFPTGIWLYLPDYPKSPGKTTYTCGPVEAQRQTMAVASTLGMGVFLTLHPMAGGRRVAAQCVRPRVFCVDGDCGEIPHDKQWPRQPNLIHTRGPGKWAAFWQIANPISDEDRMDALRAWPWIQRSLALTLGGDRAVCDLARVMRVSGTNHWKRGLYSSPGAPPDRYSIIHSSSIRPIRWQEMAEELYLDIDEIRQAGAVCPAWWRAAGGLGIMGGV